jgi:hypothetical protein
LAEKFEGKNLYLVLFDVPEYDVYVEFYDSTNKYQERVAIGTSNREALLYVSPSDPWLEYYKDAILRVTFPGLPKFSFKI